MGDPDYILADRKRINVGINTDARWFGFKLFENHIRQHRLQEWVKTRRYPTILLIRRNLFNLRLSQLLVKENKEDINVPYAKPIAIDTGQLLRDFERLHRTQTQVMQWRVRGRPRIKVEYEHFERGYLRTLEFLEVEYAEPEIPITKQRTVPRHELITNYEEVVKALRGTKWEEFLYDDDVSSTGSSSTGSSFTA
jgi:hypothetical protein